MSASEYFAVFTSWERKHFNEGLLWRQRSVGVANARAIIGCRFLH